jgi:outer membrane receptor protein involved in Fe transport
VSHPDFSLFPTGFQYYYGAYASLTSDPGYSYYDPAAYYGNGGNEIADLLLGLPGSVNLGLQLTNPVTVSFEHHAYFQGSWRLTSRWTLNYGLRYEYEAAYAELHQHQANFDLASQSMLLAGAGGNSGVLVHPDKTNFAPRIGLSWQLNSRTVLRSGYGLCYTPENSARSDILTKNYPFCYQQTFASSPGSPFAYVLDAGVPRPTSVSIPAGASSIPLARVPGAST